MKGASLKYLENNPGFLSQQPDTREVNKLSNPRIRRHAHSKQSLFGTQQVSQQESGEQTFSKFQNRCSNTSTAQHFAVSSKDRHNVKLLLSRTSCSPNTSRMYERLTSNDLEEMSRNFFLIAKNKSETNVGLLEAELRFRLSRSQEVWTKGQGPRKMAQDFSRPIFWLQDEFPQFKQYQNRNEKRTG